MDKLNAMQIFIRVAELASFTKAADSLGIPKGSVSTTVQNLESHIGSRLLHRTTRTVHLTQDGQIFYERCKDLLADVDDVESMFQQVSTNISGRLRVDMPIDVAKNLVIPNLPKFLNEYPNIEIELSSTDRKVDLIAEGFDCVIRVGALADSGFIARPLGYLTLVNCVSPAYLKRYGEPLNLGDLSHHHLVHYSPILGATRPVLEYVNQGKVYQLEMQAAITVNNTDAYNAACLAGLGIIQVPYICIKHLIDTAQMVQILSEYPIEPMPISILYPNRRNQSKRVQVFMEWIKKLMLNYAD